MESNPLPSKEDLDKRFDYCEETGNLYWKHTNIPITTKKSGYLCKSVLCKRYFVHRIIWKMMYNEDPLIIDHINGIKTDNRLSNLRSCTKAQNCQNSKKPINNTSGYKGVCWSKSKNKWKAYIRVNKCLKHLGFFNDPKEAYQAYCKAAQLYFGEFSRLE